MIFILFLFLLITFLQFILFILQFILFISIIFLSWWILFRSIIWDSFIQVSLKILNWIFNFILVFFIEYFNITHFLYPKLDKLNKINFNRLLLLLWKLRFFRWWFLFGFLSLLFLVICLWFYLFFTFVRHVMRIIL